jgi:ABC-2 type transport system permease protein
MFYLYKKELAGFFSSLTGYIAIIIFLTANSLFLWVFPGEYNVLDVGLSDLSTLFFIAPWVFLFLVPAITMRQFADEKRSGTLELILTSPLSEIEIIFAKYFAGISLVLFSIIPSLIYFLTVGLIGNPEWNIDSGAFWGSFIGLFFLASVYTSIGIFASSLSENQIVSFLISMIIAFFIFIGFEAISSLKIWGNFGNIIENLGINYHYKSMSRGVIDSRDLIYFVSVSAIFLTATSQILQKKS